MSAVATLSTNPGAVDFTATRFEVEIAVTLSGNYGGASTHGDTLDLSQLGISSSYLPVHVDLYEASPAGAVPSGNTFRYMPGSTQANGLLSVFSGTTEFTEASAYGTPPFAITGFSLLGVVRFVKNL